MAAPTIRGTQTAYAGYTFLDLQEFSLNERGATADSASTSFVYQAGMVDKAKKYIKDGIAYLYAARQLWFPVVEADVIAEAQADLKYSKIALPADCANVIAATIGNVPLTIIDTEEYAANLNPTNMGGGTILVDTASGGSPSYARQFIVAGATAAAAAQYGLEVLPSQTAVFTIHLYYKSSGQALSGNTDTVYLPLWAHPMLLLYCAMRWRMNDGDPDGYAKVRAILISEMDEIGVRPPSDAVLPVIHNTFPAETATRR